MVSKFLDHNNRLIQKFLIYFLNLDAVVLDSTQENFANINLTNQMKLNKLDEV